MAIPNGQYSAIVRSGRGVNRMRRGVGFVTVAACLLLGGVVCSLKTFPPPHRYDTRRCQPGRQCHLLAGFPAITGLAPANEAVFCNSAMGDKYAN
jgi:hypothetical protein